MQDTQQRRLPIFDANNSPQNISVYAFLLGSAFGASLTHAFYDRATPQLSIFLAALAIFHVLEYIATALFNPQKLTLGSYLINHSDGYNAAHAAALIEFITERYFFPEWKTFGIINFIGNYNSIDICSFTTSSYKPLTNALLSPRTFTGFSIVVIGQSARTLAMFHAKTNFSHYIVQRKEHDHFLVTTGIYSIMRHPSYFGFYWWALGSQVMLLNPICFIGFLRALHRFFTNRIRYEESTLIRFFGAEYEAYKQRTRTFIPFIP
ncbi:farnesyl cysteine-carboxyl methyltransferase, mediates the carboxyl methylation step during C-termin [Jimgerdemannia flammicorona]|uniref:Protein-S-isoprenylcysteine O-methyltransferase n=1 Tax=Jimgerdemannia flammicorona TaxID=994334 RepID=A0A433QK33_9FUNG|nr:farnesyl cysteine-carboxyl methyltransferase, mediates the carboxyl methylation step during C-termin [Jimgerdemannia flammicorona]